MTNKQTNKAYSIQKPKNKKQVHTCIKFKNKQPPRKKFIPHQLVLIDLHLEQQFPLGNLFSHKNKNNNPK